MLDEWEIEDSVEAAKAEIGKAMKKMGDTLTNEMEKNNEGEDGNDRKRIRIKMEIKQPVMEVSEKYPGLKKVEVDRQEAVGMKGTFGFDSGCNLSRLQAVHIYCKEYRQDTPFVPGIESIYFEFKKSMNLNEVLYPYYNGRLHAGDGGIATGSPRILKIDKDDSIVQIDVWAGDYGVCGIRFHLKSGMVSEIYGAPNEAIPRKSFKGKLPSSKLVGLHGCYDKNIENLGFTFLTPKKENEYRSVDDIFIAALVGIYGLCLATVLFKSSRGT